MVSLRDMIIYIFVRKYLFFSLFAILFSLACCILQQAQWAALFAIGKNDYCDSRGILI